MPGYAKQYTGGQSWQQQREDLFQRQTKVLKRDHGDIKKSFAPVKIHKATSASNLDRLDNQADYFNT